MTPAPDSPAAYTLVDKVRTEVHAIGGAEAKVGGGTAINKDVETAAAHDRDLLIPLILGVVLLILGLLLRAIVAPLVLIATVVLSFASALGISALFFKHVFGFAGADTGMPLFVFVFLVALGIDYNIIEAFDQPWKAYGEGAVGSYWGVYDVNRRPKFDFTGTIVRVPEWHILAAVSVAVTVSPR